MQIIPNKALFTVHFAVSVRGICQEELPTYTSNRYYCMSVTYRFLLKIKVYRAVYIFAASVWNSGGGLHIPAQQVPKAHPSGLYQVNGGLWDTFYISWPIQQIVTVSGLTPANHHLSINLALICIVREMVRGRLFTTRIWGGNKPHVQQLLYLVYSIYMYIKS